MYILEMYSKREVIDAANVKVKLVDKRKCCNHVRISCYCICRTIGATCFLRHSTEGELLRCKENKSIMLSKVSHSNSPQSCNTTIELSPVYYNIVFLVLSSEEEWGYDWEKSLFQETFNDTELTQPELNTAKGPYRGADHQHTCIKYQQCLQG